eukprot:scaffold71951_cov70-Phaeocystis_antarctica.AAC.2
MWHVSSAGHFRVGDLPNSSLSGPQLVPEYHAPEHNSSQLTDTVQRRLAWPLRHVLNTLLGLAPGQCRRALGRRQRLLHGGDAARIVTEVDVRARRHRAAPEGGGERGHPGVGDLVAVEVQLLQVGHRPLPEERGQGGHRGVAHLVVGELEHLQLPQPAACVRGPERLAQREHLRVVPPQAGVEELDDRRHLRGEGPAIDLPHEPHIAGIRKLGDAGRDARLERRGKRGGRHRRLARGLAVLAHLLQAHFLARQRLEADERIVVLDEAARVELHYAPATPLVRLRVGLLARGEVGIDEKHVRAGSAGWEAGGGQDGGRQGVWAAHLQRSLEGGELLWRAVILGRSPESAAASTRSRGRRPPCSRLRTSPWHACRRPSARARLRGAAARPCPGGRRRA